MNSFSVATGSFSPSFSTKDASTSFYMDKMRKGTHELEYEVYVNSSGRYVQGVPVARSVYAPELGGHGVGGSLFVK